MVILDANLAVGMNLIAAMASIRIYDTYATIPRGARAF